MKRVAVFCGSATGNGPEFTRTAERLVADVARRGWEIVYGAGNIGLMGVVADAAIRHGVPIIGVIPGVLADREVAHQGLTHLHLVHSMHERKRMMAELADGFVALPGGLGTLEEIFEVLTWAQLGLHAKPCGFVNTAGFYDHLLTFLDHAAANGLIKSKNRRMVLSAVDPVALLDEFAAYRAPAVRPALADDET